MNWYKVLNLTNLANSEMIEQSYLDLIKIYNPKNNTSPNSLKKYREIKKAYQVLSNEKSKMLYDLENKFISNNEPMFYKSNKDEISFNNKTNPYNKLELNDFLKISDINDISENELTNIKTFSLKTDLLNFYLKSKIKIIDQNNQLIVLDLDESKLENNYQIFDLSNSLNLKFIVYDNLTQQVFKKDNIFKVIQKVEDSDINENFERTYFFKNKKIKINKFLKNGLLEKHSFKKNKYVFDFTFDYDQNKTRNIYKTILVNKYTIHNTFYIDQQYNIKLIDSDDVIKKIIYQKEPIIIPIENTNSNLLINFLFVNKKLNSFKYLDYELVNVATSYLFNLLGGKYNDFIFLGFRGKNAICPNKKRKKLYIFSGESKEDNKLSYFLLPNILLTTLFLIFLIIIPIKFLSFHGLLYGCLFLLLYVLISFLILNIKTGEKE